MGLGIYCIDQIFKYQNFLGFSSAKINFGNNYLVLPRNPLKLHPVGQGQLYTSLNSLEKQTCTHIFYLSKGWRTWNDG